jgi:hypothetical protein
MIPIVINVKLINMELFLYLVLLFFGLCVIAFMDNIRQYVKLYRSIGYSLKDSVKLVFDDLFRQYK